MCSLLRTTINATAKETLWPSHENTCENNGTCQPAQLNSGNFYIHLKLASFLYICSDSSTLCSYKRTRSLSVLSVL